MAVYLKYVGGGEEYIGGVPARDLTRAEYDALPTHLQGAVEGSALYEAARKPRKAAKGDEKSNEEATE